uniref:Protein SPT2 homolog n=1 Tax=Panagrellus redivivus TaxID=6233 RepID=A0A7E4W7C4_PANRE
MNSSFKELLRQAEMAQKERDEATHQLKVKKKKDEEARRQALVEQFKRAKPALSVRQGPLPRREAVSSCAALKKPIVSNAVRPFRPSTTASAPRRTAIAPSTANRSSSKPGTSKPPKPRSNLPKKAVAVKTPATVKPRPNQPSLSFAEMMKLAQNNVAQGISPLDRPKPSKPVPLPPKASNPKNISDQKAFNQKRKHPQASVKAPLTYRSVATADTHSMQVGSPAIQNRQPVKLPNPHIQQHANAKPQLWSAPKRLRRYSEDEADSMDDFIDDDEEDLEAQRELKSVVQKLCRSDQSTWKKRECEIDITRMENSYRCVEMEEKRTARIALIEDKMEQGRGAQIL